VRIIRRRSFSWRRRNGLSRSHKHAACSKTARGMYRFTVPTMRSIMALSVPVETRCARFSSSDACRNETSKTMAVRQLRWFCGLRVEGNCRSRRDTARPADASYQTALHVSATASAGRRVGVGAAFPPRTGSSCKTWPVTKLRAFLVLVAGEPIEPVRTRRGGYANIIRRAAGEPTAGWLDVDLGSATALPAPSTLAGVVVTGSSASVTERASWMLRAEEYLRLLVRERVPTLGICFGHQLLAQALGGEVVRNPRGREIGTVDFEIIESDPLFSSATAPLQANATHVDTIGRLPEQVRVLARTELEPHAAVRFAETAWGVQFHPEMDAGIIRDYLDARREVLFQERIDPDALLARTTDAAAGASTLTRFLEIARSVRIEVTPRSSSGVESHSR
jgi:GMP synthase (glutamine-hydrolysing)